MDVENWCKLESFVCLWLGICKLYVSTRKNVNVENVDLNKKNQDLKLTILYLNSVSTTKKTSIRFSMYIRGRPGSDTSPLVI